MIVLDAGPVIALARSEPAAADIERILRAGGAAISAVNLAEAVDVLARLHGVDPSHVTAIAEVVDVRAAGLTEAHAAARLRASHYHRTRRPLSLADCFLLAGAGPDDEIATSDQAIVDTAREEGIRILAVANSRGVKPRVRR